MSDVVVRSSVKSGGMVMVSTGTVEVGVGGVITIYKRSLKLRFHEVKMQGFLPKT
jgi:hypothetical protein